MENNELINKLDELLAKYNAAKKKLEERRNLHKPTPPAVIWSQLDLDGWSEELKEYENIDHQLGQQAVEAKIEMRQALDCMDNLMKVRVSTSLVNIDSMQGRLLMMNSNINAWSNSQRRTIS